MRRPGLAEPVLPLSSTGTRGLRTRSRDDRWDRRERQPALSVPGVSVTRARMLTLIRTPKPPPPWCLSSPPRILRRSPFGGPGTAVVAPTQLFFLPVVPLWPKPRTELRRYLPRCLTSAAAVKRASPTAPRVAAFRAGLLQRLDFGLCLPRLQFALPHCVCKI